ncbi:hypothetical protein EVAR_4081_1 [Eumeta japonica]|uniref:Uncharacterized protein n=1 Tax=Eumeta variegata TaxID=151549 RepID=A0A4C1T531_EUMVA|nr:hypothetical protein EVAR_4081_1 [Eumeta japonica]
MGTVCAISGDPTSRHSRSENGRKSSIVLFALTTVSITRALFQRYDVTTWEFPSAQHTDSAAGESGTARGKAVRDVRPSAASSEPPSSSGTLAMR